MVKSKLLCLAAMLAVLAACSPQADLPASSEPSQVISSESESSPAASSEPEPSPAASSESESSQAASSEPESSPAASSEPESSPAASNEPNITMTPEEESYAPGTQSIVMLLQNNSAERMTCGTDYTIEAHDGAGWVKVPLEFGVEDLGLLLDPGETHRLSVYLYTDQYEYTPGSYRVVKEVTVAETQVTATGEFTIQ